MPEATSVSIHAPTRGATPQGGHAGGDLGFNSRAHAGRDVTGCEPVSEGCEFQFTRPRGARLAQLALGVGQSGFNSRAHAGRDVDNSDLKTGLQFQFTRPRGARQRGLRVRARPGVSIHAPTRGATSFAIRPLPLYLFQFTRPRGARLRGMNTEQIFEVSIHAPTRGATIF